MGYGDEIMATAEAREAKKKFPNAKIVIGDGKKTYPSIIYLNNPNIYQGEISPTHNDEYIWVKNYIGHRPYILGHDKIKNFWNKDFSVIPGDIFFSKEEDQKGIFSVNKIKELWSEKIGKPSNYVVVVEPNVKGPNYAKLVGTNVSGKINKDWGFEKWQQVINSLKDEITFIQPFKGEVRKLSNVIHVECSFRNAISIINQSNLFIGSEGGFSHAAGALKKNAIIVFGGWISPKITGYEFHENLYIDIPESPCGILSKCKHCESCMEKIKVDEVISKIIDLKNKS